MPDTLFKQDGSKATAHVKTSDEAKLLLNKILSKFDWFKEDNHGNIADEYLHEYTNTNVIRVCANLSPVKALLPDNTFIAAHRLFDLDNSTSVLYTTEIYLGETPTWLPPNSFLGAETKHYAEFGRPCDDKLLGFKELFFITNRETGVDLGFSDTDYNKSVVYSAIVSSTDVNKVYSFRKYLTDNVDEEGVLANWQILFTLLARKAKRADKIRDLYKLDYLDIQ